MKFVIDMNLSPSWQAVLQAEGWDSVHWSEVGSPSALDHELLSWTLAENRVVLTHDLDFGAILAATKLSGPSVVQIRTQDIRPKSLAPLLIPLLRLYESEIEAGALLVLKEAGLRVRMLPLNRS